MYDESIVIRPADKRSGIVILVTKEYEKEVEEQSNILLHIEQLRMI